MVGVSRLFVVLAKHAISWPLGILSPAQIGLISEERLCTIGIIPVIRMLLIVVGTRGLVLVPKTRPQTSTVVVNRILGHVLGVKLN